MKSDLSAALFGLWAGIMLTIAVQAAFYEFGSPYKQGQIDAVTGKMQFELKKQSDGTLKWERKEK